ncbi:MAG: serine/threonine protein kinase [candidate division Zixibacteria bacterium]|nr:serine/threonine protein kinase [candidate division Zixibacteria bacterium]MDD5425626.1 serine/threonine protein kinase [candidate division Zixibacteria bacterium]
MDDIDKFIERIRELTGWQQVPRPSIITDTSDWTRIKRGDIMHLDNCDFLITGNRYETRFGIEDQPKYWVFSAFELATGRQKIIKTVFHEDFYVHISIFRIHCYRSPEKESRVLDLVRGDERFMQGYTSLDEKGNHVRIIDFIKGKALLNDIHENTKSHEQYFHEDLPDILKKLTGSLEAIALLHRFGTCHGDIRNDHIIIERDTGKFRWIDFDLNQHVADFDVWSIGNIINYAVGKGINSFHNVLKNSKFPAEVRQSLCSDDSSAFYEYRIMNLKKLYPYIPEKLSNILLHFTINPKCFYKNIEELLNDYTDMLETEFP